MNLKEITTLKEAYFKEAKSLCNEYYNNEFRYKFNIIEQLKNSIIDSRLQKLDFLIEELTKISERIKELDSLRMEKDAK